MSTELLFPNCPVAIDEFATDEADQIVAFGQQRHWIFEKLEMKGVLQQPLFTGDFYYTEFDPNSNTLPGFAQRRLDAVLARFPVKQVIIGHEVEVADEAVETETIQPLAVPKIEIPEIDWGTIAKVAIAVVTGAVMVFGYAILTAASMVDPKLIVVCEGSEEWICLVSWGEHLASSGG